MSNRGRGRGNYGNQGGYFGRNQNQNQFSNPVPIEIIGWNGASIHECANFIARKCKITVTDATVDQVSGAMKCFVKSDKDANDLLAWSGVKFAGQSLRISKSSAPTNASNNTIDTITQFLKSRYQPETKMLNLSAVSQDPMLSAGGFFASISTTSKFFPALMKVAGDLKLDVSSVDLSGNNLSDLTTISSLAQTFPTLKNLSLLNNNFSRLKPFENWRHKLNFLRELILLGNPYFNNASAMDIQNAKTELMKSFPRLVVFNGEIIRNEELLNKLFTFPFEGPQSMFFQDEEVQSISTNFVTNFFKLWDSDRAGLMVLYQNESQFSMQVDSSHPHAIEASAKPGFNSVGHAGPDFGYYLPESRNLMRVSSVKTRASRLATGQEQIFKLFSQIPKTRHDLMAKPYLFSMESYRYPQLNGIMISLHGSFEELAAPDNLEAVNASQTGFRNRYNNNRNKKVPLCAKSFDRSFIIIPTPNGSMIVASDLLTIRPFADADAWNFTPAAPTPLPVTPSPSPAPNLPTVADLPPEAKANLNQQQQEILVKVLLETKLTLNYGVMLCEQSNWDYNLCTINFKNSVGSLPPDAFLQQ